MTLVRKKLCDQIEKINSEIGKIQTVVLHTNKSTFKFCFRYMYELGQGTFGVVMLIKCIDFYPFAEENVVIPHLINRSCGNDKEKSINKIEYSNKNEYKVEEAKYEIKSKNIKCISKVKGKNNIKTEKSVKYCEKRKNDSNVKDYEKLKNDSNVKDYEKLKNDSNVKDCEKLKNDENLGIDQKLKDYEKLKNDQKLKDYENLGLDQKLKDYENIKNDSYNKNGIEILKKYALKTVYEDNRYHNRELDILKSISHKNVIKLFGHFRTEESTSGSFVHLILEFIPFSLSDLILKDRICKTTLQRDNMFAGRHANVMQVYDVRDLYRDALRGLAYLHNLSICHRDIKPSNLMVDRAGQLKIADLGSAKQIYSGNRNIPYICSRPYRAPENLLGHDDYNVKIDIWALGCVFMEIFSKKPVFKVVDDAVQLKMILSIIQVSQKDIDKMNRKFDLHENVNCIGIKSFIKTFERFVDEDLIEVMVNSLVFNPEKRMMAKDLLEMPYFKRDKN